MRTCALCSASIHDAPTATQTQAIRDNVKNYGYRWLCLTHTRDDISLRGVSL